MPEVTRVATIFHGSEGALLVAALKAAGYAVEALDPLSRDTAEDGLRSAVSDADVVLSLNSPTHSRSVAAQTASVLKAGAVYADLTPSTPATKKELAKLFPDGAFVDVALRAQEGSPASVVSLEVSGTGAHQFLNLLGTAGLAMEYVSDVPGDARARAVVRSLLAKSLSAAVIDTLWAAESLGLAQWAHQEVLHTIEAASTHSAQDSLRDTATNFKRRQMELLDVQETLRESGYESTMAAATDYTYGSLMHGKKIPYSRLP